MRGKTHIKKRVIDLDAKYQSEVISRFINKIMQNGKKATATKLVYDALDIAEKKANRKAIDVFETAIQNASPILEVRSRRIGGANYQVPREVTPNRKLYLAMRWIIDSARSKKGSGYATRLADEIFDAYENKGASIKRREELHKMAEANRAFAHFGRF
ncbi:MAG: 30S ribosomal protein S7 [Patescibacteria group bacterium]